MIVVQVASALCLLSIAHATWVCRRQIDWSEDPDEGRDWDHRPTEITWTGSFPRHL